MFSSELADAEIVNMFHDRELTESNDIPKDILDDQRLIYYVVFPTVETRQIG
jgi:hypothetical protein